MKIPQAEAQGGSIISASVMLDCYLLARIAMMRVMRMPEASPSQGIGRIE